jgi:3-dehydroquinate synthase
MKPDISDPKGQVFFGSLSEIGFEKILTEKFPHSRFVILIDENVAAHWSEFFVTSFDFLHRAEIIEIPAGEENKTLEICNSVWEALSEYEINRNDVILNIGGGMITDLGGFVASTFKRGLHFVNIPTSLLAQVDASVGGKTGVDLGPFKNQVGLFAEPDFVFIDSGTLSTLPHEQILSGFAEMLKHGLIADADYWKTLRNLNLKNTEELLPFIRRSVELKKSIVEQDYSEKGIRKTLNFGHTIGHALEGHFLQKQNPVLHGHAVGLGMIGEAYLSLKTNLITQPEFDEIKSTLLPLYGTTLPEKPDESVLLKLILNDKKNSADAINFSLLKSIGNSVYDQRVSTDLILESFGEIF